MARFHISMLISFFLAASWLIPTTFSAPTSVSARGSGCSASTRIAAVRQVVKAHTTGSAADANAIPLDPNCQIYTTVDNSYTYLQDNGAAAYRQTIEQNAVLFSNVKIISTTDYPSNLTTLIQYQYNYIGVPTYDYDLFTFNASCYIVYEHGFTTLPYLG